MMKQNKEAGYTLIGVLAIFTILTVLGISLVMLSVTSVKTSTAERENQSVFYIAEAGLNYKMNEIEKEVNSIYASLDEEDTEADFFNMLKNALPITDEKYEDFVPIDGKQPQANISVEQLSENGKFNLISIGTVGEQTRTVAKEIVVGWSNKYEIIEEDSEPVELPPFAVFTGGDITFQNGTIKGAIGTLSTKEGSIKIKNDTKENVFVPGGDKSIVSNPNKIPNILPMDDSWFVPSLPDFPEIPSSLIDAPNITNGSGEYEIKHLQKIDLIEAKGNSTITLDIGDNDKTIVVNKLAGNINIVGKGKLKIFVTDTLDIGTINQRDNINNLDIFYKGKNEISLTNHKQNIYGSIYVESAAMKITGGSIYGNIFYGGHKTIELAGNPEVTSQLVLAPNAKVEFRGKAGFKGMIVSNEFDINGNGSVTYDTPFILDGPISPSALGYENGSGGGGSKGETKFEETGASPLIKTSPTREVTN